MSQKQQKQTQPKPPEPLREEIEVRKVVEPPPIAETVTRAAQALAQAKKRERLHRCRVCGNPTCPHFMRVDITTGEEFDQPGAPDLDRR